MFDYCGYSLDDNSRYDLTEVDMQLLDACIWLVDNRSSIRVTAKNFGVSKSSLHRGIHNRLPKLSNEIYRCITKQININFAHRTCGRSW